MESNARGYKNWLFISVLLVLLGITVGAIQFKVPVIMSDIAASRLSDPATASSLMSMFSIAGIIMAIPTGVLAGRFGAKTMMLVASGVIVVGSVIGVLAGSDIVLVASRTVEGIGYIFITICGPLAIQKYVQPDKIGSATGIWALWVCVGSVLGGVLTPTLYSLTGFAGVWIIYAVAVAVAATLVALFVSLPGENRSIESDEKVESSDSPANYSRLLSPNVVIYFIAFAAFNMVLMGMLTYCPSFLQMEGIDPTVSGFISTLPMLLAIVSSTLFGVISDKIGRCKPLYLCAMLVCGPCCFLMLTQTGISLWVGAVVMGLIGLGGPAMCMTAFGQVLNDPKLMPIGMGILMLMQSLGQFFATVIVPLLLGQGMSNWLTAAAFLCAVGLAGTVLVAICRFK